MIDESTLDPQDWSETEAALKDAVDLILERLSNIGDEPAWQRPSAGARAMLDEPIPREGTDLSAVLEQFTKAIWPYPTGNIHPRFWGWVMGTGTNAGLLADLLTSGMNSHVSGYDQAASLVEHRVLGWLCEIMGYDPDVGSGLLVSGGTVANLIGLVVARHAAVPEVREGGLYALNGRHLRVYASDQVHGWAKRSCDLLGIGTDGLRLIESDAAGAIRVDALRTAIERDKAAGDIPMAVIGTAGTVNSGAFDDLEALADVCADEGVWFHIDGAFGAMVRFSENLADRCRGIERADSIGFDLHKWGYMQMEVGVVLARDREAHESAFSFAPSYLDSFEGGIAVKPTEFAGRGLQLTRSFRALKVWMSLKHHGVEAIGRAIEANVDQARYLADIVGRSDEFELLAPCDLNVVCFRYAPTGLAETELNRINKRLLVAIQEAGVAVPSNVYIDGRYGMRVAITNHRTRRKDLDLFVRELHLHGANLH